MEAEKSDAREGTERLREETEALVHSVFSRETQKHLVKAGSEFLLALDSMLPHSVLPPETRQHMRAMRREFLLMARSIIDSKLESVDEQGARELEKIDLE